MDIGELFDYRLIYQKGAFLLHMLRWELGDSIFFQALRSYVDDPELRHSFVRTEDLQEHLESVSGTNLNEFFQDWLYGQGFPSHKVEVIQEGGKLRVKVEQAQSHSSVGLFELTLPLQVSAEGVDTTYRLRINNEIEYFDLTIPFKADQVTIDPERWIISANNTVSFVKREVMPSVFPNPAGDLVFINLNDTPSGIRLLDHKCALIFEREEGALFSSLDTAMLAAGTYLIEITYTDGNKDIITLVKQ
jgi:hypothetical protein